MKAKWKGVIIAESETVINIEGNSYFPTNSVKMDYLVASEMHTICHWKGTASYYDLVINGVINKDAAWYYPNSSGLAAKIKNYIAFWQGVEVFE